MACVFKSSQGSTRTYRMLLVSGGFTAGADDTLDSLAAVPLTARRVRIQNIGSGTIWMDWNKAAVADNCIKLAAGDAIELEQERDDLVLWHLMGSNVLGSALFEG